MGTNLRLRAIAVVPLMAIVSAVVSLASPAAAQCFCLAHPVTQEIIHFGCEARTIPNRVSERVTCLTASRTNRTAGDGHDNFSRVPDGEGACNPCAPPPDVALPDIVRQPDGTLPDD